MTDLDLWPRWGPSVRAARLDGGGEEDDDGRRRLGPGSTGRVSPLPGVWLPFEVTDYVEGRSWGWRVLGVPATDHLVEPLSASRCRVSFGVPLWAPAYVVPCALALRRIDRLADGPGP